ncbi:MAG: saccharopine dehydrogenase C-terminal domain-containing protein [Candidatus Berkiellales bacterium]
MEEVLIVGAGKIGSLVATLLALTSDYHVHIADIKPEANDLIEIIDGVSRIRYIALDLMDPSAKTTLATYVKQNGITTVISCLPYFCNVTIAELANECHLNYFDLTEDAGNAQKIRLIGINAEKSFVPQCGLAPGFISIAANDLMKHFDQVDTVLMRVGALPVYPNNALKYSLTWSTDGLINEYGNNCYAIVNGREVILQPLEGLETIQIDGLLYEAFNTSGGVGTLADTYDGRVNIMNYKTLRYPGHCQNMRFLMSDLKLNQDRATLKKILENALSKTNQDVVIIYVAVKGYQPEHDEMIEETYVKKIYPKIIAGKIWSAIQITTASSVCAVVDIVLKNPTIYQGLVLQESITLKDFLSNRFGLHYL